VKAEDLIIEANVDERRRPPWLSASVVCSSLKIFRHTRHKR